jgi:hypothetical protein
MLQHIVGRQRSWAIAAFLFLGSAMGSAMGCGDDSGSGNDTPKAGKGGSSSGGTGGSSSGGSGAGIVASDKLQGTGDMCHSYTAVDGDKCQGWYCGVTEKELSDAVDPKAKCGGNVPLLCMGSVTVAVGKCARDEKTKNFSLSNDELKPLVRDCVYKDEAIKAAVPENCLDCTIDVAECAADNCLAPCLGGDTPQCDTCRLQAKCDQKVFGCGELPAPIKVD